MKNVSKPSRYSGVEINPYGKRPRKPSLKIAFSFPEVYELGMSHYGFLLLYYLLKKKDKYLVDRVFAPWIDMEKELRMGGEKLKSLEFGLPLSHFDVIGFSLAYELSLTNVLTILDLSGIPLLGENRKDEDPLILCGGALAANPEPFSSFFDGIFIGEGEEGLLDILAKIEEGKRTAAPRKEIVRSLSEIEGVYVPSLYKPLYDGGGNLEGYEREKGAPQTIKRRIIQDIEKYTPPPVHIFPSMRLVHDRIAIEIARGCTRGCRFCQAGYYYRPMRERNADSILDYLKNTALGSGFDEVGFLSLSSSDYSCINELIKESMDILEEEKISISLPSLRINTISEDILKELKRVRKGGFTIAPEAGLEGLRRRINKQISDDEIFSTVEWIFRNGWHTAKMYFMIGLPGEGEDDLYAIRTLSEKAGKIARGFGRKNNVTVSVSTFVPKPHTPFQWSAQISRDEMERKIKFLKKTFSSKKNITFKWHSPQMSWLEGIITRGDRKMGQLIASAYKLGARLDAWSDQLKIEHWERALDSLNLDPDIYTGPREIDQFLPWDIIYTGTTKEFLKREREKSFTGNLTPDCRVDSCSGCGVCIPGEIDNRLSSHFKASEGAQKSVQRKSSHITYKYIATYRKVNRAAYLSALEVQSLISRTLRLSRLPVKFTEGYNPKPKISFPAALPVGIESQSEFFIITLTEKAEPEEILQLLSRYLPAELSPFSVIPAEAKISLITLEDTFEILPESDGGGLPELKPKHLWEKVPEIKMVKKMKDKINVTVIIPSDKSSVKKVTDEIFGCSGSGLNIKISKISSKILLGRKDDKRQIYPHKQQAIRNTGGGS